jgi:DNA-binding winged helix-turn-helix (wHTH) protein
VVSPGAPTKDVISFGPFSLIASERILTKEGAPVELGARALDTLIVLLSRPNEVITKRDLLARVWTCPVSVDSLSSQFLIIRLHASSTASAVCRRRR